VPVSHLVWLPVKARLKVYWTDDTESSLRKPSILPRPISTVRLDGGRLCLNFVNTIHDRHTSSLEDYISTPERFFEWSLRAGAIESSRRRSTLPSSRVGPAVSADVRRLRNRLHSLFSALIDGTPIPATAIQELDKWVHRAWRRMQVDPSAKGWLRRIRPRPVHYEPLEAIALSALELLRTSDPARLRRCQAPNACGWLFYDNTKNGSRRWCSMSNCGIFFKMRRYRIRGRLADAKSGAP
jgi:predicted RNA-binding Zn ribbon-like protein